MYLLLVGGAMLVGTACMLAGPVLLSDRCWTVRRPRLAIGLWLTAFLGGLLGYLLTIVVTIALALAAHGSSARGQWAIPTALVLGAWIALISVGALVALVLASVEPIVAAHHEAADRMDLVAAAASNRRTSVGELVVVFVDDVHPLALSLPRGRRVLVTSAMVRLLSPLELRSVIEHERAHVRYRHHRLMQVAQVNAACLPRYFGARRLQEAVRLLIELVADDAAARVCGARATADALRAVGRAEAEDSMILRGERIVSGPMARRRHRRSLPEPIAVRLD